MNLRAQERKPAIDMGEGFALAWPFPMTCRETTTTCSAAFHLFNYRNFTLKQTEKMVQTCTSWMVLTFEGSPDRKVSQGDGMSNQKGPQGEGLIQFTQCYSQTGLTTQTSSTKLQPMVNLQIPGRISNEKKKQQKTPN